MSQLALHAVKEGFPDACGHTGDDGFQNAAHAVPLRTGGANGGHHGRFPAGVQQGKMTRRRIAGELAGRAGERRVVDAGAAGDMGVAADALILQDLLADSAGSH